MGLASVANLPSQLKALMLGNGAVSENPVLALALGGEKVAPPPLALTVDKDGKRDRSAFIGDLMSACPEDCRDLLTPDNIQCIASYMIDQGWRKIS
jgi:hypothetical protein